MLKSQQRFRSQKHNVFTEVVKKVALSADDGEGTHSIGSRKHIHITSRDIIHNNEEIEYRNITKQYKKILILMTLQKKA